MSAKYPELAAHLGDVGPAGFAAWAWEFSQYGWAIMVQAALVAARVALPAWENHEMSRDVSQGSLVTAALDHVSQVFGSGERAQLGAVALLNDLRLLVDRATIYVDESSGYAELVASRERALSAAIAALATLEAFCWTEAD